MSEAIDKLPYFEPNDSTYTLFSSDVANTLVAAINRNSNIRGNGSIQVAKSGNEIVIWIQGEQPPPQSNPNSPNNPNPFGGLNANGSGSFNFRGEWGLVDYFKGDAVIRSDASAIDAGNVCGTFLCVNDAPNGSAAPTAANPTSNWQVVATGAWPELNIQAKGSVTSSLSYRIELDPRRDIEAIQGTAGPDRTIRLREVNVCLASPTGSVTAKMLVLGSEFY